ncbi:probable cyclic nucleotide-gated ion channel 16 [Andrographis paniculata]|uniref:probable cyclic nucleotide-gated ion channel 16 n=1 Tax=Andrographis paniculata TaxID=175694 RepID=UPI0021E86BD6|nr:probable cyclic nucleotide-gated ion channel 16 [Andrographis paniculata]
MNHLNIRFVPLPNPTSAIRDRHKDWWLQIQDPSSERVIRWNRIFFATSLVSLFVDPLFFILLGFLPDRYCLKMDYGWAGSLVAIRTICDMFSGFNILMKFRTAYVARDTRVFGRGDLVTDPAMIARYYLNKDFAIDLAAALPLPQCVIWGFMPSVMSRTTTNVNHTITFLIILQYIPKLMVVFPLNARIIKNTGVVATTAWTGAAYNLILFLLAGHVLGSVWYLLAVERIFICWRVYCKKEKGFCNMKYLDCSSNGPEYHKWYNSTKIYKRCNPEDSDFNFGLFGDALTDDVPSASFFQKYFYNLWFGLRSLCSYGQSMKATPFLVETSFSIVICLMGLVFFALLIGNVQTYLQSTTARLEEWRIKRKDTEEWMRHRQLPDNLQDRVRRFVQYNWQSTRGVKEDELLQALPLDLRRLIQKHLCLDLVRRVPFFSKMDDQLLDAICGRLVSSLHTKCTYIVREGDPVNEMLFIIRGQLESSTTDGGRSGFFNSITLKPGDFCGEELLTWALMIGPNLNRPASTRTVKCITEVEGFALRADDLKFFANQFKRLHSKKLQHVFRYYSHQWRTWGARILQAAWRRHKRRKLAEELARHESMCYTQSSSSSDDDEDDGNRASSESHALRTTFLASRFAANTRRGRKVWFAEPTMPKLLKPGDPNF